VIDKKAFRDLEIISSCPSLEPRPPARFHPPWRKIECNSMHIGSHGKLICFIHADNSGERTIPRKLYSEPESRNSFLAGADPSAEGWTVRLSPTICGVNIDQTEIQFHLSRPFEANTPHWDSQRHQAALSEMADRESKTTNENRTPEEKPSTGWRTMSMS
jgi:hypothetical protein